MRIFVAGATGAIGRALVPRLVEQGHDVTALVRSPSKSEVVKSMGASPAVADALDRDALTAAITTAAPEVIIHQLTALAGVGNFKRFDAEAAVTNRLRTEALDTMIAAARNTGTRRMIVQSYLGWPLAREGGSVKSESDPLDLNPPPAFRRTLEAIRYLEDTTRRTDTPEMLALRYGMFYGPGTGIAPDGVIVRMVRERKLPLVGNGAGIWSFVHVRDAASATLAAIARGAPGIYNIVDDEPAPVAEWLPYLAQVLGAKPPRRIPAWLAKFAIGDGGVSIMTKIRGGSNAKAKRELGWQPELATWRTGFVEALAVSS